MTDLETAKTLRDAAQYIRDHGWIQGSYGGPETGVCAIGAILRVSSSISAASAPLYMALLPLRTSVTPWNDTPGRTVEEVLDLFESLALQHELRALAAESPRMRGEVPEAVHA